MEKIWLIISQEYRNRVAKKSFLLLTFLMPLMFVAIIVVPVWLASMDDGDERTVAVVDNSGLYAPVFEQLSSDDMKFELLRARNTLVDSLRTNAPSDYRAVVLISDDLMVNPNAVAIYSQKQVSRDLRVMVERALSSYIEQQKLQSYNIEGLEQMIEDAKTEIDVSTYKWNEDGSEGSSSAEVATVVGMIATTLIYLFIFISGAQVMSAVVQEKTNRIVEVMICSVKPWQLMWGKIISVALVTLTQIAAWIVMTSVIAFVVFQFLGIDFSAAQQTTQLSSDQLSQVASQPEMMKMLSMISSINWGFMLAMFILFFIGGYLLYASLFAAIGASVDNEADTQQFMMPITIVVMFALYAGIYSAENPDGPLAFWCSIIPFTSPIVMMVRLPFEVPVWQLLLSISLLILTVVGTVWLSAKIYRVGILMYGKKTTWRDLYKWLKY